MEISIKINKKRQLAYIPNTLFKILDTNVKAVPNRAAVLLFSEKTTIDEALTSLDIIKADLQHAKTLQQVTTRGKTPPRDTPRAVNNSHFEKDESS
jgi:hypothetical protein